MTPQPNSLASNAIDTGPAQRLVLLEATIRRGLSTFIEVGNALAEIRDARLYREQGFRTFEDYCLKRWRWGRNYANKQIAAARVIQNLGTTVPNSITERQARELASLPPEQQREVAAAIDFTKATAQDIRVAVERRAASKKQHNERARQECQPPADDTVLRAGLADLRKEITRRRKENECTRGKRRWNVDAVLKVELIQLLDWIESELDKLTAPPEEGR
jgi:hypothetical protein